MTSSRTQICKRLQALGYKPIVVHRILSELDRMLQANGPEWVIARLKSMKSIFISLLAGQEIKDHAWIRFNGIAPKGAFRPIFRDAIACIGRRRIRKVQRALAALMCYTAYIAPEGTITCSQLRKVRAQTGYAPEGMTIRYVNLGHAARKIARRLGRCFATAANLSDSSIWMHKTSHCGLITAQRDKSLTEEEEALRSKTLQEYLHDFLEVYTSEGVPAAWTAKALSYREYTRQLYDCSADGGVVGTFRVKQQPGFKARAVAHLEPLYQGMSSHLGNAIYLALGFIPEDCRDRQEDGIEDIRKYLAEGNLVSSIDLKAATDSLSFELQEQMLEMAFREMRGYIEMDFGSVEAVERCFKQQLMLIRAITKGIYECNTTLINGRGKPLKSLCTVVRWTWGQPQGAYFSFGLFSLLHHAIIRSVEPKFYRILGDDLVVSAECTEKVLRLFEALKVPISWDKTILNSSVAEFAGKLITPTKVFTQPKIKGLTTENFVDVYRGIGPCARGMLKPKYREVVELLDRCLPEQWRKATGFNTRGEKYAVRSRITDLVKRLLAPRLEVPVSSADTALLVRSISLRAYRPRYAQRVLREIDELREFRLQSGRNKPESRVVSASLAILRSREIEFSSPLVLRSKRIREGRVTFGDLRLVSRQAKAEMDILSREHVPASHDPYVFLGLTRHPEVSEPKGMKPCPSEDGVTKGPTIG